MIKGVCGSGMSALCQSLSKWMENKPIKRLADLRLGVSDLQRYGTSSSYLALTFSISRRLLPLIHDGCRETALHTLSRCLKRKNKTLKNTVTFTSNSGQLCHIFRENVSYRMPARVQADFSSAHLKGTRSFFLRVQK